MLAFRLCRLRSLAHLLPLAGCRWCWLRCRRGRCSSPRLLREGFDAEELVHTSQSFVNALPLQVLRVLGLSFKVFSIWSATEAALPALFGMSGKLLLANR